MRWADAHREAMVVAADALDELALDEFERIDVFEAIVADGLKLMFRKLECAALYLPARNGMRPGAIINANHPLALQRFSGGHEYAHHVFGHGGQIDLTTEPRAKGLPLAPEEKLAEAFAAWFLMPPEAAETALRRLGRTSATTPQDAYAVALRLGTSFCATCIHLPTLKLAGAGARDWSELQLKSLKQELTASPPPGGWRNDIWVLGDGDIGAPVVARAGDRLRVELPGTTVVALPAGANAEPQGARDLFGSAGIVVDLDPEMKRGPKHLDLSVEGAPVRIDLMVERDRLGRFVPAPKVSR